VRELNEEFLAFSKAQTGRRLPMLFPIAIQIDNRFREIASLFGLSLGKLVNERIQDALRIAAGFLVSTAIEVRQFLRRRNVRQERIYDP